MSEWTQPQCEACWVNAHKMVDPDTLIIVGIDRIPHRVIPDLEAPVTKLEICAYCGAPTFVGIYVRADPTTVPFPSGDGDD